MKNDESRYYGVDLFFEGHHMHNDQPKVHGAFGFCDSWGKNVIIHTPTRYSQATKDYLNNYTTQDFGAWAFNSPLDRDDIRMHAVTLFAYVVNHDKKHLYEVANNVADKKCIVLTEYDDIRISFSKYVANGAQSFFGLQYHHDDDWAKKWHDDGNEKPLLLNFRQYKKAFSDLKDIPVHVIDLPFGRIDQKNDFHELLPLECELNIYPVMGTFYSCLLRLAASSQEITSDQISFTILNVLSSPQSYNVGNDPDEDYYEESINEFEKYNSFINEMRARLKDENDPAFISFIQKYVLDNYMAFEARFMDHKPKNQTELKVREMSRSVKQSFKTLLMEIKDVKQGMEKEAYDGHSN